MTTSIILKPKNFAFVVNIIDSNRIYLTKQIKLFPNGFVGLLNPITADSVYHKGLDFTKVMHFSKYVDHLFPSERIEYIFDTKSEPEWAKITKEEALKKSQEIYNKAYEEFMERRKGSFWMRFFRVKFHDVADV